MAFAIVHHFPGGTKENYEASIGPFTRATAALPDGSDLPRRRRRRRAAGRSWPSTSRRRAGSSSATASSCPGCKQGIEGGFPTPPEETEIDVYKVMP